MSDTENPIEEVEVTEETKPVIGDKLDLGEDASETSEVVEEKPKFKLNPEIKGMIGIFFVILILGLIMAASMGKFEQWFGIDIFAGAKITNKVIFVEEGETNKVKTYDFTTGKINEIYSEKDLKDIAISPTGKKIAYVGYEGDEPELFLCKPDFKKPKSITKISGSKSKPKFSPDGKYLAYIANGRVFRADLNGSNAVSLLPTKQEQQTALNGRDGKLVMKDYVWAFNGDGMLGVVARSDEDERLVIMSDSNGDAHEVPFPDGMNCKFISLSAAPDSKGYVAVAKSHGAYILFLVQEPEEHNHNPQTPEEMGVFPMPLGTDPISYAFLMPEAKGLMLAIKSSNPKTPSGVYMLDFENQQMQQAFPFDIDKFEFTYVEKAILYKENGPLQILDMSSPEPTTIGEKVNSYTLAPPKEVK